MENIIETFKGLSAEELFQAGGKGGTLARLYQAGYPVPDGFVILPAAFKGDELVAEGWSQVQTQLNHMRKAHGSQVAFAVRSSAACEDSIQASFAGEFESVLDVHSDAMIREAILTVRRSRSSERVLAYSRAKGIDAVHELAVVVQQLVQADISGVLFTANPVTGSRESMPGNYIFGLGDDLVSGEVEPYTFNLMRPKGQYEGPTELKRFARTLFKLGTRLERELGAPQDIEWCIADGEVYLLQSRPITTLLEYDPVTYDWNSSHMGDYLWGDTAGIFPDVMTPGTNSIWQIVQGLRLNGVPFMGNIGGKFYANYSLMYSMMRKMGRSHQTIIDSLSLISGKWPEEIDIPHFPVKLLEILAMGSIKGLIRQRRLKNNAPVIFAEMPERCEKLRKRIRSADKGTLSDLWNNEVLTLFMDMYAIQDTANDGYIYPYTYLKQQLSKVIGEERALELISKITGGNETQLSSVGIGLGLSQVSRGDLSREEYMERYGHRHSSENEISIAYPREDPNWLVNQLAILKKNPVDVEAMVARSKEEFERAWSEFETNFPRKAKSLKKKIDQVVQATHFRESTRSELTRSISVIREWFLQAGELTGLREDIFFLTYQEVLDALSGDESAVGNIPARKETHDKYLSLPPYPAWIRGRFDPVQWASDPNRNQSYFDSHSPGLPLHDLNVLKGFPGSSGRIEGLVHRMKSPDEASQFIPGEILVAVTTNVGWTPIFPQAAAVITEVGAPLSHAAIVAREMGIPAVVGCRNASQLKTGDRVLVDGGRGIVEILGSDTSENNDKSENG
jgi:pyruvate,water dikinase